MKMAFHFLAIFLTAFFVMPCGTGNASDAAPATARAATEDAPVVTLSDTAAKEIAAIIKLQELNANVMLRVGVKAEGKPLAFSYILDLTESPANKDDFTFVSNGIKIVISVRDSLYLRGTTIEFKDADKERGFVFKNPNALSDKK